MAQPEMIMQHTPNGTIETSMQSNTAVAQTQEQQMLMGLCYKRLGESKRAKAPFEREWDRCWGMYNGNQWPKNMPRWKARIVINRIFQTVESMVPRMTQTHPRFEIIGDIPETEEISRVLEKLVESKWKGDWKMRPKTKVFVKNLTVMGTSIWKTRWDSQMNGIGEIAHQAVSPYDIFPDPIATDVDDCEWLIHAVQIPVEEARRRFPAHAGQIKPDPGLGQARFGSRNDQSLATPNRGQVMMNSQQGGVATGRRHEREGTVYMMEMWHKDDSHMKQPLFDEKKQARIEKKHGMKWDEWVRSQGQDPWIRIPLYPNGRCTIVVGNAVVKDMPNPFAHGKFPFVKVVDHVRPDSFWGIGTVINMISPQKELNKRKSQSIDILNYVMNSPLIVDSSSGVDENSFRNKPDAVIQKTPGSEVSRLQMPPIPSALFKQIDDTQMDIDTISGNHDVVQGRRPKGVTAASAISELQEEALIRVRDKIDNNEEGIRQLGELDIALMKQFYHVGFIFPVVGLQDAITYMTWDPKLVQGVQFQVNIEAGSTMPVSRTARAAEAFQYYQARAIDRKALLQAVDFPNWKEVDFRMTQHEILLAQIAAQGDTSQ